MVGDDELTRLASLLKLSSEVAKAIAQARRSHVAEIYKLADQAADVATRLEAVAQKAEPRKSESKLPAVARRH